MMHSAKKFREITVTLFENIVVCRNAILRANMQNFHVGVFKRGRESYAISEDHKFIKLRQRDSTELRLPKKNKYRHHGRELKIRPVAVSLLLEVLLLYCVQGASTPTQRDIFPEGRFLQAAVLRHAPRAVISSAASVQSNFLLP